MLTVRSIADLNATIVANLHRIPRDVDAVVGIPRSGMLAASMIALHLQAPLADVPGFCRNLVTRRSGRLINGTRILLVDDTVLKGRAMRGAVAQIKEFRPDAKVTRLAVWNAGHTPPNSADIILDTCPCPRAFAWNLWRHKRLPRWACDLDGVLCVDPTNVENDDGPRYERFIATAAPRFRPQRPLGWIVTARLEKYRALTEAWLATHGITYRQLVMMDLPNKAARMAQGGRGAWKADIYHKLAFPDDTGRLHPAELFIESSHSQAKTIATRTGKPSWCTDGQVYFPGAARKAVAEPESEVA